MNSTSATPPSGPSGPGSSTLGSSTQLPGSSANPREVARPGAGSQFVSGPSGGSASGSSQLKSSQSGSQAGSGGSQSPGRDSGAQSRRGTSSAGTGSLSEGTSGFEDEDSEGGVLAGAAALADQVGDSARSVDEYVRSHPWQAAGIAAAAGVLVGMLVMRR